MQNTPTVSSTLPVTQVTCGTLNKAPTKICYTFRRNPSPVTQMTKTPTLSLESATPLRITGPSVLAANSEPTGLPPPKKPKHDIFLTPLPIITYTKPQARTVKQYLKPQPSNANQNQLIKALLAQKSIPGSYVARPQAPRSTSFIIRASTQSPSGQTQILNLPVSVSTPVSIVRNVAHGVSMRPTIAHNLLVNEVGQRNAPRSAFVRTSTGTDFIARTPAFAIAGTTLANATNRITIAPQVTYSVSPIIATAGMGTIVTTTATAKPFIFTSTPALKTRTMSYPTYTKTYIPVPQFRAKTHNLAGSRSVPSCLNNATSTPTSITMLGPRGPTTTTYLAPTFVQRPPCHARTPGYRAHQGRYLEPGEIPQARNIPPRTFHGPRSASAAQRQAAAHAHLQGTQAQLKAARHAEHHAESQAQLRALQAHGSVRAVLHATSLAALQAASHAQLEAASQERLKVQQANNRIAQRQLPETSQIQITSLGQLQTVSLAQPQGTLNVQLLSASQAQMLATSKRQLLATAQAPIHATLRAQLQASSQVQPQVTTHVQLQALSQAQHLKTTQAQLQAVSHGQLSPTSQTQLQIISEPQLQATSQAELRSVLQTQSEGTSQAQLQAFTQTQFQATSQAKLQPISQAQLQTISQAQPITTSQAQLRAISKGLLLTTPQTQIQVVSQAQLQATSQAQPDGVSLHQAGSRTQHLPESRAYVQPSARTHHRLIIRSAVPSTSKAERIITTPAITDGETVVNSQNDQHPNTSMQGSSEAGTSSIHTTSTLTLSSGTTLIMPHYKTTVFKNLSTIASAETSRLATPITAAPANERVVIRRPVAYFSARRTFPTQPSGSGAPVNVRRHIIRTIPRHILGTHLQSSTAQAPSGSPEPQMVSTSSSELPGLTTLSQDKPQSADKSK